MSAASHLQEFMLESMKYFLGERRRRRRRTTNIFGSSHGDELLKREERLQIPSCLPERRHVQKSLADYLLCVTHGVLTAAKKSPQSFTFPSSLCLVRTFSVHASVHLLFE